VGGIWSANVTYPPGACQRRICESAHTRPVGVVAAFLGCVATDLVFQRMQRAPERDRTLHAVAAAVPVAVWVPYFVGLELDAGPARM
jgi:bacteriorhodopsin